MPGTADPVNVGDYEALARECMERGAFDYYAGAACDEQTHRENRLALDRLRLRPRMLVDVSRIDTGVTVLGTVISMPVMLAPTALNRLAHPDGELAAARAAGAAGTLMVASCVSTYAMEEIASAANGPLWFQLYVCRDRDLTRNLVERAAAAGYLALVITVDTPLLGKRERDVRNSFGVPKGLSLSNFEPKSSAVNAEPTWRVDPSFAAHADSLFDPSITWDEISWLRSLTRMPVIVKGILTPEDARLALAAGVAGIIVSNHGGRQLDGVEAAINALPAVVEAVGSDCEVFMDGGIRRGSDVLKALALGARAVLIGRSYLWGLAVGGEKGVRHVLELLRGELELAMGLSGRPTIASIDRSLVHK
ncbi:MAG: alpha-hydroxy acid oxidase [Gemmatimonadaceae bacterium]